jgi:hypothetical protein
MILLLAGALIAALGLYSGLVLVLGPLGVAPWMAGIVGGVGTAAYGRPATA